MLFCFIFSLLFTFGETSHSTLFHYCSNGPGCCNPSLGLETKARACKGASQRGKLESHISCSRECRGVWRNEPSHSQMSSPFWELESQWIPKPSKSNYKGQHRLDWDILYITKKLLECGCLKWTCMTHLNTSNISYDQKKGRESNWQFDSRPLKVKNCPNFLVCRWYVTYCWKALNECYKFSLYLISIGGLQTKLWAPKVAKVQTLGISWLPLGSPRTKCHLGVGLVARHKVIIRGKVVASPNLGHGEFCEFEFTRGSS
jgi:hypothetical protein